MSSAAAECRRLYRIATILAMGAGFSACSAGGFFRSGYSLSMEQISEPILGQCVKVAELAILDADGAPVVLDEGVCVTLEYTGDLGGTTYVDSLYSATGCSVDSAFERSVEICAGESTTIPIYALVSNKDTGDDFSLSFELSSDSVDSAVATTSWEGATVRGRVRSISLSRGSFDHDFPDHVVPQTVNPFGCALMTNGTVQCWGDNEEGQTGQTEEGEVVESPIESPKRVVPEVGGELTGVVELAVGKKSTCAITDDGDKLRCWGENQWGTIGAEPTDYWSSEGYVPGFPDGHGAFSSISVGVVHSCVLAGDQGYCWGGNLFKGLGNSGAGPANLTPVSVASDSGTLTGLQSITAGAAHSCAFNASELYCWGRENDNGGRSGIYEDLGYVLGRSSTSRDELSAATLIDLPSLSSGTPTLVRAGWTTSCLLRGGKAWCWGESDYGQLGDGRTTDDARAASLKVATTVKTDATTDLSGIVDIQMGYSHACALTDEGKVYCWGSNSSGELGPAADSDEEGYAIEVDLPGDGEATSIAAGDAASCAVVGDEAYCWGEGSGYRLPTGAEDPEPDPVHIDTWESLE